MINQDSTKDIQVIRSIDSKICRSNFWLQCLCYYQYSARLCTSNKYMWFLHHSDGKEECSYQSLIIRLCFFFYGQVYRKPLQISLINFLSTILYGRNLFSPKIDYYLGRSKLVFM